MNLLPKITCQFAKSIKNIALVGTIYLTTHKHFKGTSSNSWFNLLHRTQSSFKTVGNFRQSLNEMRFIRAMKNSEKLCKVVVVIVIPVVGAGV